jgi:tetratricopeptide repeat protein 30
LNREQDYRSAVTMYETLTKICPGVDEYKIYYAQSLYKAGMYPEAMRAAVRVDNPQYAQRMLMLQVRGRADEERRTGQGGRGGKTGRETVL